MEKRNVYAARLETEGVLFEIDRKRIVDWLLQNHMIEEADKPKSDNDRKVVKPLYFINRTGTDESSTESSDE